MFVWIFLILDSTDKQLVIFPLGNLFHDVYGVNPQIAKTM